MVGDMKWVDDLMKGQQLSKTERKKVHIGMGSCLTRKAGTAPQKAFKKLLSERVVRPEVTKQALGWIWCPVKGSIAKSWATTSISSRLFRIQGPGRHWRPEGPWMVSHVLLVVTDFNGYKTLDEVEFASMSCSTAPAIGEEVGTFMEMEAEADSDEILAGRFVRLKVKLDIHKPLMCGVTIVLGEDRWCPLSYEYLPEFCYYRSIIGHVDRSCQLNEAKKALKVLSRVFG